MPRYKIADIVCEIDTRCKETAHWYEPYLTDEPLDFPRTLTYTDSAAQHLVDVGKDLTLPLAENMLLTSKFNTTLLHFDGSYIHSSALKFKDKVYLFSGPSGVGKSTHTRRWCRLFPEETKILNDDKPSFRFIDDKCYIYGTPFAGGTDIQINEKGELGAIVFLEQADENRLVRLSPRQAIVELTTQTPNKRNAAIAEKMLELHSRLISEYPVYKLYCADNDESVSVAMDITKNS